MGVMKYKASDPNIKQLLLLLVKIFFYFGHLCHI